jgi:hypothetical protein
MLKTSWQRILVGVGLSTTLAVGAIALATMSPTGSLAVYAEENPRVHAQEWLRQNGGSTCSERPIVDYFVTPRLLEAADQLEATDGWLYPGHDDVYVGDIAKASFAGVSGSIARSNAEAWVMGTDAEGPFVAEYRVRSTPNGRSLWLKTSWERPLPESACRS